MSKLILFIWAFSLAAFAQQPEKPKFEEKPLSLNPAQLKPASFAWSMRGPRWKTPFLMLETISSHEVDGQKVWRVVHLPSDLADNKGFAHDGYDLDYQTLRPRNSTLKGFHNDIQVKYEKDTANITVLSKGDAQQVVVNLPQHLYPDGPGWAALLAALPLKEGFSAEYYMLDRNRAQSNLAQAQESLVVNKIKVIGREEIIIAFRKYDTYIVEAESKGGMYSKSWVLTKPPHYRLKAEFMRAPNTIFAQVIQDPTFSH